MGERTKLQGVWSRLERRGILVDDRVGAALREVPIDDFVAPELLSAAPLDAPLPTSVAEPTVLLPAPRHLAMLLQMLELEKGVSVLLLGTVGGYVESLVERLVEPGAVTVWEEDERLRVAARTAMDAHGSGNRLSLVPRPPPDTRFDRVTTTEAIQRLVPRARDALADMGFAVFRRYHEGFGLVKVLRSGEEFLELSSTELAVPRRTADGAPTNAPAVDVGRELQLARMLENVWKGRPESEHEQHFLTVVDDTFARPGEGPPTAEDDRARYEAARRLFHIAYIYQSVGDWEASAEAYAASIAVRPTAEAHTFLGWVFSFEDRHQEAIAECEKAIGVDPSFGNPYNDIGAYLIELERLDEAIPWFERAKKAKRYCCYFYAYSNLGRVYMMKGMREKARREFEEALRINPTYDFAREMLRRVDRVSDYIA